MKFVVTVMVRDEIDVIAAMIEHTLSQGPDLIIVTDNGSVDGTREVLQQYADHGLVELHDDPIHRKQQHAVVTAMARRAHVEHGADWVINADADEFWIPVDTTLTLRDVLERIPTSLGAFTANVVNVLGRPARYGSGLTHMTWRDLRSTEQLHAVGIHAQPTPNAVHRGDAEVVVAQGNHFVSIVSEGQPDAALAIEVLHAPWRSWTQLQQKVLHAGRAYEASPDLRPSKNHHGMADYRRQLAGRLEPAFLLRHPSEADLSAGAADGRFVRDDWLSQQLCRLSSTAVCPDLLAPLLDDSADDAFTDEEVEAGGVLGRQFLDLEQERQAESLRADTAEAKVKSLNKKLRTATAKLSDGSLAAAPTPLLWRRGARRLRRLPGRAKRRVLNRGR